MILNLNIYPRSRLGLSIGIQRNYYAFCFGTPRILDIFYFGRRNGWKVYR